MKVLELGLQQIRRGPSLLIILELNRRPTARLPLPLLISAVILVCFKNNARLNFGSATTQIAPPQLKLLTFSLLSAHRAEEEIYLRCKKGD